MVQMTRTLAVLVVIAAACLAAAATAGARSTAQVCPSFAHGGKSFFLETIGDRWTCSSAKSWAVKLMGDKVPQSVTRSVPLKNGPAGYHCFALPGSHGRATDGTCFKGTLAFPKTGFAWTAR
jgi:hypothetical protein